jgi:hypothetical protein
MVILFSIKKKKTIENFYSRTSASEAKYTRICERISNFYGHLIKTKTKLLELRKEKHSLVS